MITFPNAKINIGLDVICKRDDGYHNIESLFIPVPLKDTLEILPTDGELEFTSTGIDLACKEESNLVVKAFRLLQKKYELPNVKIHLHKNIPFGAGLGGGSADAAQVLMMINQMYNLHLTEAQLMTYAAMLGADCAFFIKNTPCIATGIGEVLQPFNIDLTGKYLLLVKPDIAVPTANAYKFIVPQQPVISIADILYMPIEEWKFHLKNDFEASVFIQYPSLKQLKQELYDMGAIYASMSGSGSTIFGIFDTDPHFFQQIQSYYYFTCRL